MKTMTIPEFQEFLMGLRGAKFASFIARTRPQIVYGEENPLYGRVEKIAYVNGIIGYWSYSKAVNRVRAKEGGSGSGSYFVAEPRRWGERQRNPFVCHKGQYYLDVKVEKVVDMQYLVDGVVVPIEQVRDEIRVGKPSRRQRVKNPVIPRDYKLSSIKFLLLNQEIIEIRS